MYDHPEGVGHHPNFPDNSGNGAYSKVAPLNTANGQAGPVFADTSAYERFYNNRGFDLSFGTGETALGTTGIINASAFTSGISSKSFTLGNAFNISKQQSSASLYLSAVTAIYYSGSNGNTLIVAAGGRVPFYSQVQTWTQDQFDNNELDAVVDLRVNGIYGSDFNANMINNGAGSFGASYNISVVPAYQIYNDLEAKSEMGEITIRFSSVTVNTITRKLRPHWTPELAQDLEAYHSIDAEAELTSTMSEFISMEIPSFICSVNCTNCAF